MRPVSTESRYLEWASLLIPQLIVLIIWVSKPWSNLFGAKRIKGNTESDAMAFTDPQTVTINAVPNTLPRVSSGVNVGSFSKDDGTVQLSVSHAYGKRNRRTVRLNHSKIAPDPLISSTSVKYSMSVYIVIDTPLTGYTIVEQKQLVDALTAYLTATSGARVTQLLGGEN